MTNLYCLLKTTEKLEEIKRKKQISVAENEDSKRKKSGKERTVINKPDAK